MTIDDGESNINSRETFKSEYLRNDETRCTGSFRREEGEKNKKKQTYDRRIVNA